MRGATKFSLTEAFSLRSGDKGVTSYGEEADNRGL